MTLGAVTSLNRAIRDNRLDEVTAALGREPGMRALGFAGGCARWEWHPIDERARNPFGFVFGGYLAVFVDALASSAMGMVLDDGELATTADLRIDFLRPARFATLLGEARVLHKGRRVAFVEARIRNAKDSLVVTSSSTWTIIAGEVA